MSPQASPSAPLLEVHKVRKAFPGVLALDDVSFQLEAGSVHALMGENGAGKSTLMKIIAGVYTPDSGEVRLRGKAVSLTGPLDAINQGIAMIHQELNLMPYMTVAENIWIRREPTNALGFVRHQEMKRRTSELFERLDIHINPEIEVRQLSIANRQMVEIAKAVSMDSDLLIMDEPTSALTEKEVEHLFRIIRQLKEEGKGVIYITHKMNELFEIADMVSVFRDGRYIDTKHSTDVNRDQIIQMMVGREITQMFPKEQAQIGEVVLSARNLTLKGVFHDISFDLHRGEILGIAGLVGSGRSNVAEALFGVVPATTGEIHINGKPVKIHNPTVAMLHGMSFLTEDRKESGCFLILDVLVNMSAAALTRQFQHFGFIQHKALHEAGEKMLETLKIKTPNLDEPIQNLSGGNQQKALIGRWLLTHPSILIMDEPTRGIDVGAKAEIHRLVSRLASQGVAVLMISSELPEVLGMSDRIMVMHEGRVSGFLSRDEANQVSVMRLASN